ncbi:MAG: sulfite exporter TauE/SafE family protein [Candidatus Omnitrophota bacterium]
MVGLISIFVTGLFLGCGPCLLGCGPLVISYAVGTGRNAKGSLKLYFLFSLSRLSAYLFFSLSFFLFGSLSARYASIARYFFFAGGLFIIFIGLLMAGGKALGHGLCRRLGAVFLEKDKKTIIILGLLMSLIPCAPFLSVMSYISLGRGGLFLVLSYVLTFWLGTVVSPLLLMVISAGRLYSGLIAKGGYLKVFNFISGSIMVFLGVRMATSAITLY